MIRINFMLIIKQTTEVINMKSLKFILPALILSFSSFAAERCGEGQIQVCTLLTGCICTGVG